jgi:hypothetical protein
MSQIDYLQMLSEEDQKQIWMILLQSKNIYIRNTVTTNRKIGWICTQLV